MTDPRAGMTKSEAELRRIADVYTARDSAAGSVPDAADRIFTQQVERSLAHALRVAAVELAGAAALEVGCGSGHYLHLLHTWGATPASGIDLMEGRIETGRTLYPDLDLRHGSATDLPYTDAEFGLVAQFTCLSSVLDPEVRGRIAQEMWRVLAPGGVVVSFDMRPAPAGLRAARRLLRSSPPASELAPLSGDELAQLFPGQVIVSRAPALHPGIIRRFRRSPRAVAVLSRFAPLRSHLLMVIRKRT